MALINTKVGVIGLGLCRTESWGFYYKYDVHACADLIGRQERMLYSKLTQGISQVAR